MIAKNLINDTIIPLRTSDNGYLGMQMMDEYKVEHLPIVNQDDYVGLIAEIDILNSNDPEMTIGNHILMEGNIFVYEDQHIFDVIEIVADKELTLVPVISRKQKYIGVITMRSLAKNFAELAGVEKSGSIIIVEVNINDYSLSQIAQIVEYNDAKVISCYTFSHPDSTKMEVTIKVNKNEVAPIIQTFNRYNYIVKDYYSEQHEEEDIQDRYDEFMTWLNV
ncbi:MAG: CBS domain-containing protein [Bacteroidota bacterium]